MNFRQRFATVSRDELCPGPRDKIPPVDKTIASMENSFFADS